MPQRTSASWNSSTASAAVTSASFKLEASASSTDGVGRGGVDEVEQALRHASRVGEEEAAFDAQDQQARHRLEAWLEREVPVAAGYRVAAQLDDGRMVQVPEQDDQREDDRDHDPAERAVDEHAADRDQCQRPLLSALGAQLAEGDRIGEADRGDQHDSTQYGERQIREERRQRDQGEADLDRQTGDGRLRQRLPDDHRRR